MKRRRFFNQCAAGAAASLFSTSKAAAGWKQLARQKAEVETRGSARNLIFILLGGAPSHVDFLDLKLGSYTPNFLGVETKPGGLRWPSGTLPKLGQRLDKFSVVRSISAVEAVHERAIYHVLTGHRLNPSQVSEIPHFSSVVSHKFAPERSAEDVLPSVIRVGRYGPDNGFLADNHLGLILNESGQVAQLEHPYEGLNSRLELLQGLLQPVTGVGDERQKLMQFQAQAKQMMSDPTLRELFSGAELTNAGPMELFQIQCEMAVNVLAANKGARFIQLGLDGWDHHVDIYADTSQTGFASLSQAFDSGMAYLLDQLDMLPGQKGGSLLDETLVVAAGEFGRTTGNLNTDNGRDHYPVVVPALFAGGGVVPGRIIGSSNADGSFIVDPGWSQNRYIGVNDLIATMYSALGIDWTERIEETPSGRVFEFIDTVQTGPVYDIDSLFV